jgi:predicted acylesterase/phospholipase RssA
MFFPRHRPARTLTELFELRKERDAQLAEKRRVLGERALARAKARYDAHPGEPVVWNLLVISGGGDWGAFGAGFLKGWSRVQGPLTKPEPDVVTGVSTGALISPFAFLGDDESIEAVIELYRNPKPDWVKTRWPFYFLPANESFATVPGLEREMRARVDMDMLHRVADASRQGRSLLVNTSDIDNGGHWVWDVGSEAQRAAESGNCDRVHQILLASSGIPGAFPFREIDGSIYVDGGVTANLLYGGARRAEDTPLAMWTALYPHLPVPTVRFGVIFNNQLRPLPQLTKPAWPAVFTRSLEMATRAATITAIRHLFSQAEIARLKHGGDIEIRFVAVPDDFVPPKPGVFVKETMNALADLGEKMGADPSTWSTSPP